MSKFKIGDRVKIVKYGHLMFYVKERWTETAKGISDMENRMAENEARMLFGGQPPIAHFVRKPKDRPDNIVKEDDKVWWCDINPSLIGKEGIIQGSYNDLYPSENNQEHHSRSYSVTGIHDKQAWYDEDQLELCR